MKTLTEKVVLFLAVVALIAVVAAPAGAELISLNAVGDARINNYAKTTNYETYGQLTMYNAQGGTSWDQRSVLTFDLSSIPENSIIDEANLILTTTKQDENISTLDAPCPVNIWRVTTDWLESQVTWNVAKTGVNWTAAGGDFVGTTGVKWVNPYDSFSVPNATPIDTVFSRDVTTLVQEWYASTYNNYGFELASNSTAGYDVYFGSLNNNTESRRPVLEITYSTIPEPGTLALLAAGLLGLLCYAWRKRK